MRDFEQVKFGGPEPLQGPALLRAEADFLERVLAGHSESESSRLELSPDMVSSAFTLVWTYAVEQERGRATAKDERRLRRNASPPSLAQQVENLEAEVEDLEVRLEQAGGSTRDSWDDEVVMERTMNTLHGVLETLAHAREFKRKFKVRTVHA
ncbi:MAG: hypothetical protein ABR562_03730, partial [Thermoplasmatota archaeon]